MKRVFYIFSLMLLFSCDDIVEVQDISDDSVTILAPTNGVTLTTTAVTFNWNAIEDADNYRIQIATPTFNEAQQVFIDSLTPNLSIVDTLEVGEYEWRIRAENSEYQTLYTTQSFNIEE